MDLASKKALFLDLSIRLARCEIPPMICDSSGKPLGKLIGISCFTPEETFLVEIELESGIIQTFRIEDIKPRLFQEDLIFHRTLNGKTPFDEFKIRHIETLKRSFPERIDGEVVTSCLFYLLWKLSNNFDAFNLIESELAIPYICYDRKISENF